MKISEVSLVVPNRQNLCYFKWMYDSVRKNIGSDIQICAADDASTDGTAEYFETLAKSDPHFSYITNDTGKRQGHTLLYDKIIHDLVTTPLFIISHCDMYWTPSSVQIMLKHIKLKTIVSATRIEPANMGHPPQPIKHLIDMGDETENFKEEYVLNFAENKVIKNNGKTTEGIFAPWMAFKEDFVEIGGHDLLYAPQSKEDSDIFNRFQLNGVKFIQPHDALVAHLTCRGSRRNTSDKATDIYTDSPEWLAQNERSSRNFIRKWGHYVKHDQFMKPIIPHKYDIGFVIDNGNEDLLYILEPWCSDLYTDIDTTHYYDLEKTNTMFNLDHKLRHIDDPKINDIVVKIDAMKFGQEQFDIIQNLSLVLDQGIEPGEFELKELAISVREVAYYENDLIHNTRGIFAKVKV